MDKRKVLIVEDDKSTREAMTEILELEGYAVQKAVTAREAIDTLLTQSFDIILCDLVLPDLTGFSIIDHVIASHSGPRPVIIIVSGLDDRDNMRKGMELGVDDYVTKPFTRNELLKTIKTQLAKKEQLKEEMEQGSELKVPGAAPGTQRALNKETFLFLADSRSASFVKMAEIKCIISDKDYSKIFIKDNKRFILKKSLRSWLGVLPKSIFLRINKSTIINLNFVLKVEEWFNGSYMVYLDGASEPFNISTRTAIKLRKDIFVRKV